MSTSRYISLAAIATTTFGCTTARPSESIPSSAHERASSPTSAARTLPAPSRSAALAESPVERPSPFRVVVEHEREPLLHDLGDRGFVSVEQALYLIEREALSAEPSLTDGLPEANGLWRIAHLSGKWPDSAWLDVVQAHGSTGRSLLFSRRGQRWQQVDTIQGEKMFVGITPWTDRRWLGIVQSNFAFDATFRPIGTTKVTALPLFSKPEKALSFCTNRVRAETFAALPSGHVFVGGIVCDTANDEAMVVGAAVERWEPGRSRGTIDRLPGMDVGSSPDAISVDFLVALSPIEVYATAERVQNVAGSPRSTHLFRFDGTSWTEVTTPNGITGLWLGRKGTLWAADAEGQPCRRTSEAAWSCLPLPAPLASGRTTAMWQAADGGVWAVAGERDRWAVVHAGEL